ncbi:hypothetical protein MKX01_020709 [Papaver californicum]|nr:hypothetical protein MKX01_020709 [Papaver californicum]
MISFPSNDKSNKWSSSITNLPGDCLNLIFKYLKTRDDRNSFGLTYRHWIHIQNNNQESLWYSWNRYCNDYILPKCFPKVFFVSCSLDSKTSKNPEITDFVMIQSQFSGSKIQKLCLRNCSKYSDTELSLMFSWFPRLQLGLEALGKCCPSLEFVNLLWCCSITDSGISFLIKYRRQLGSLYINSGIEAIVSGGGLEYLHLSTAVHCDPVERCMNTEVVMSISKGCPLLKYFCLSNCERVELEGWEAIGRNCKNLEFLHLFGCTKLGDLGLHALCDGCNKLSRLYIDNDNSCSRSAVELFKSRKPNVMVGSISE